MWYPYCQEEASRVVVLNSGAVTAVPANGIYDAGSSMGRKATTPRIQGVETIDNTRKIVFFCAPGIRDKCRPASAPSIGGS
jgi:hypothetical protein